MSEVQRSRWSSFRLPVSPDSVPKPYRKHTDETWTKHHVHLPFSQKSLIQLEENTVRKRWEVIQEALLRPITNSKQLEEVICSYNNKKWKFPALHYLFRTELDQLETDIFFKQLLPKIINLALRLPNVLQCGIPLLKAHSNHSITLSQLQIASLLANAFLCTYPRRNSNQPESQYANFPCINFSRLFQAQSSCVSEKLKCLINYFVRVTTKDPTGLVTYSRRYLPHSQLPHWGDSRQKLPDLFISSEGMIENQRGLLQVDFANKFVGGGVLGYGGVQEEIRFVICPELIVAQLFTECLNSTEALIVSGVERYNDYEGYSRSFTWTGNYKDPTPSDIYGRKLCTVLAIDAVNVARNPKAQYSLRSIERELNKAYVGFSWGQEDPSRRGNTVATGNWGCGAFKGDVQLKALLQIMAAGEASASIAYFTFGNAELTNGIYDMYTLLKQYRVDVGRLFTLLASYESHVRDGSHESITLYEFLYNTVVLNNSKQDGSPGKSSDKSPGKQGDSDVKTKRNTSPDLSENSIRPGNSKTTWRNSLGFNTKSSSSFYSSGTSSFSNRNSITKSTTHSQNGSHRSCDVIDSNDTIDDMLQKIEASEAALLRKKTSVKNINCQSNISELEKVYAGNSKEVSVRNSSHREVSSRVNRIDVFNENLSEPNKLREVTANNSSCSKTTPSISQNSSTYFTNERCRQDQAFSNINRNESKSNTISASKCQVVTNGNVRIDSVKNNQDFVIQIEEDDETSVDRCVSPDVINSSVAETPVKNTQDLFSKKWSINSTKSSNGE
ncbi:poly(ADP-ribose) glycohydrolase [Diaphorina citri]|uniref:poly(ADP-ribose) glycohydrolase n=1 Tax=Diaphorina citri TaxID=121845 RepID=A0A1S4E950_DIACI|nr:poly(ADP-ribose) glycohydrolase [Diaphorina citri]